MELGSIDSGRCVRGRDVYSVRPAEVTLPTTLTSFTSFTLSSGGQRRGDGEGRGGGHTRALSFGHVWW